MPPSSPENYNNSYENANNVEQQLPEYFDLEVQDATAGAVSTNNATDDNSNQGASLTRNTSQVSNNSKSTPAPQVDPVEVVKGMISTGFTPTKMQITNSSSNANGPHDSSNTWFAIFLQRLLKQRKHKSSKK